MELIIIFKKDPILSNIQPFDFFSPTNFFFSLDEFKEKIDDILTFLNDFLSNFLLLQQK